MNGDSTASEWTPGAPHEDLRPREQPLPPEADPFYQPPRGYRQPPPGTVLRSRAVELAFLGVIPQRITATQLLYRSTNLHGDPEAAVTTALVPPQRHPGSVCPVLSYQCAIDAVASRCFPSYALRRGARPLGAFVQSEYLLVAAALAEGWAVLVPDHEGRDGRWGAPYEPGYRILDGVRAALGCERLGLSPSAPVALWGYSGGGLASAWAAESRGGYAPELNIVGAVLGSPVADPGSVARRLNRTFFAGLPAMMIAALTDVFPGAQRVVDEHSTEAGKALLDELHTMTTAESGGCAISTSGPTSTCPPTNCGTCRRCARSSMPPSSGSRRRTRRCWSCRQCTTGSSACVTSMRWSPATCAAVLRSPIIATGSAVTCCCTRWPPR